MEFQIFDDVASEEMNGAAVLVLIDNQDGRRTPVTIDHFGISQENEKWVVSAVPKSGSVFRRRQSHSSGDAASEWVQSVMKAHGLLEREIAARRFR